MTMTRFSCPGNCRGVIACGFATKLCCEAVVRHEECREIAVSRGRLERLQLSALI